ncbi:hypothetical protein ABT381_15505 [Streptomyces sp. NPDC000151]|uniref:hypothetical protein n=1 Tax=Streptomyces sp. NPDC000151 TaxID=3154244 RepID=UPI0033329D03
MTVEVHGILNRHHWLENIGEEQLRESTMELSMQRAEAYGWHAPYGWRTRNGKKFFHLPDRWLDCDTGGDWSGAPEIRELAWVQADIPEDGLYPRLPVLPMARTVFDALTRVGTVDFTALRTYLPLQVAAGDASGDLDDMREWFGLASPAERVDSYLTLSAAPSAAWAAGEWKTRVQSAMTEHLGDVATVEARSKISTSHLAAQATGRSPIEGAQPVGQFLFRTREWTPDVAVWLSEVAGEALRVTGHAVPVIVTVSVARAN